MKQHALSAAFPSMSEPEFSALVEDIREHGLLEPGIVFEDEVLDGWHRYRACKMAKVEFVTQPYTGKDPVAFVRSRNAHRRHITASQRAATEIKLHEWKPRGQGKSAPGALYPDLSLSDKDMAKAADVGERTIEQAKAAQRAGLGDEVRDGKVSAKKAATVAKLPKPERDKAVAAIKAGKPVAPSKDVAPTPLERAQCRIEELQEALAEARADIERLSAIEEGESGELIKRLQAELRAVKAKRDDVMRENTELRRQLKFAQRKAA